MTILTLLIQLIGNNEYKEYKTLGRLNAWNWVNE